MEEQKERQVKLHLTWWIKEQLPWLWTWQRDLRKYSFKLDGPGQCTSVTDGVFCECVVGTLTTMKGVF